LSRGPFKGLKNQNGFKRALRALKGALKALKWLSKGLKRLKSFKRLKKKSF